LLDPLLSVKAWFPKFAREICDLIAVSRPFEIRRYYSFMRDFRHVSRARTGSPHERRITRAAMAIL